MICLLVHIKGVDLCVTFEKSIFLLLISNLKHVKRTFLKGFVRNQLSFWAAGPKGSRGRSSLVLARSTWVITIYSILKNLSVMVSWSRVDFSRFPMWLHSIVSLCIHYFIRRPDIARRSSRGSNFELIFFKIVFFKLVCRIAENLFNRFGSNFVLIIFMHNARYWRRDF